MPNKTRPRLTASHREVTGRKSEVRRLRRSGQIPGSIFGHGDPDTLTFPERALNDFLHHHGAGAILDIDVDGSVIPALIREIDRHPLTGAIIQLGLQRVDMKETLRTSLPLLFTGEETLVEAKLVAEHQMTELEVHARADLLPESITVDLTGCEAGQSLRIRDLTLPKGVEASKDPDTVVVNITLPKVDADVAAALDAEEAAHAAVEVGTEEAKEMEPDTVLLAQEE
jgi:large subunit ribosomal protein L25